jgi:ribose 5-phosphate isomerase B
MTNPQPVVALASDHAGVALKAALIPVVESCGYHALDLGTHSSASVHYPEYGKALGEAIRDGQAVFGIAICGSGIGISIAANRLPGIRAALCHSGLSAELARAHNDANILALGARLIGEAEAKECVERFLATKFEGGRHGVRVEQLG